jgi:hypothetical protein
MSIPFLDRFLTNWENPNYEGFYEVLPHFISKIPNVDTEILYKIKSDIEQVQYLQPTSKQISSYEKNLNGLFEFLSDMNFKITYPMSTIKSYKILNIELNSDIIKKYINMDMNYILQIGFGSGAITMEFLEHTRAYIITNSIYKFEYSWYSKMFIDYNFPSRHTFIMGSSISAVQLLKYTIPKIKFDLIYYSDNRSYLDTYNIIKKYKEWSHPRTIILMNAIAPHQGWGHNSYVAMLNLIKDKIVSFVEHIKIPGYYDLYTNGLAILKYNFDDNTAKLSTDILKSIEINIPSYEFSYYIKDGKLLKDVVLCYLKKLLKYGINNKLRTDLKNQYKITIDDNNNIIELPVEEEAN